MIRVHRTGIADTIRSGLKRNIMEWKPLIMVTLRPALFDNNNRLITLSGGYKNLHYLTQFIVTTFYMYKKQQDEFSMASLL